MKLSFRCSAAAVYLLAFYVLGASASLAQSGGTLNGWVADPTGKVIGGATVSVVSELSHVHRTTVSDGLGHFQITHLPFNTYQVSISAQGFSAYTHDVDVRSLVPTTLTATLNITTSNTVVNFEAGVDPGPGGRSTGEYLRHLALCRIYLDSVPRIRTSVLTQNERALEGLLYGADDFDLPIEDEVTQKAGATINLNFDRILGVARGLGFRPAYRRVAAGAPLVVLAGS